MHIERSVLIKLGTKARFSSEHAHNHSLHLYGIVPQTPPESSDPRRVDTLVHVHLSQESLYLLIDFAIVLIIQHYQNYSEALIG